jgi:hypothetical protein
MKESHKILFGFTLFVYGLIIGNNYICTAQTISSGATFSPNTGNYVFGIIGNTLSFSSKNLVFPGFVSPKIDNNIRADNFESLNIRVFPNPVEDILNVDIANFSKNETVFVRIYNAYGFSVLEKSFDISRFDINISDFHEGIYFLTFTAVNSKNPVKKLKILKI